MRVRDELKMTIAAYQTLYNSSVAFGMRKQIQAENGKSELEERISVLDKRKKELVEKVKWLKSDFYSQEIWTGEQEKDDPAQNRGEKGEGLQEKRWGNLVPAISERQS